MGSKYRFSVFSVTSCPANAREWENAAKRRNCSLNDARNAYLCLPNQAKTALLEFCYDEVRPMVQQDNCIELAGSGTVNQHRCTNFTEGCPKDPFLSSLIYTHPACLKINTKDGCYRNNPACPKRLDSLEKNLTSNAPENTWLPWLLFGICLLVLAGVLFRLCWRKIRDRFFNRSNFERRHTSGDIEKGSGEKKPLLSTRGTDASLASQANDFQNKEENPFYADIGALNAVKEGINRNRCVMIIGQKGCGKTAIMNNVALCLSQIGYIVKTISNFHEINPDMSADSKILYILDDAFGIFNYNVSFTDALQHYKDINLLLKHKYSKLLMTCRTSVYRKVEKFNFNVVVEVIDICDSSLSLNPNEKTNLLQQICHPNMPTVNELVVSDCKHQCFPLLCVLYAEFRYLHQEHSANLFQDPIKTILHFLDYLQESKTLTYICLVYVVLHGRAHFSGDDHDKISERVEMALQSCEKYGKGKFSVQDVIKECNHLAREACWLQKSADGYYFKHALVFEIVAYHYGKDQTTNLLKALKCSCINEMVFVANEADRECIEELRIQVNNDTLTERLVTAIQNTEYLDVFTNKCWRNPTFCETFKRALQTKEDVHALFWKGKSETSCKYKYEVKSTNHIHISLSCNNVEWFRQKLLEERTEKMIDNVFHFDRKEKAISWAFGYGIFQLLPELVRDNVKSLTVPEQIRFLILAIFSRNVDCLNNALEFVSSSNLDKTCLLETENKEYKNEGETYYFNKHNKFTPLTAACYIGFSEAILKLVKKGSNVTLKDKNDNFPIVLACRFGNISDCHFLLEQGATIHCKCGKGVTPLIAAVMNRNKDIVEFLIKQKVDVNECTWKDKGPLYYAVKHGDFEIVKILTKNKSNVNKLAKNQKSPLYLAAQNGFLDIAEFLIANEAIINEYDKKRKTPLYCASKRGHHDMVKLLLNNKADVNISTKQNRTPLYRATKRGHLDIDAALIKGKANVNKMDIDGYTPLYWASKRGYINIVLLLLKSGASPNTKTDDGKTALHSASLAGHKDIICLLVKNGVEINMTDDRERNALYFASKRGHLDVVTYLIKHDADVNKTTTKGKSALFRASKRNHIEVLKILIANKADVNQCNEEGESPLYFAAKRGHLEVVDILLNAGADVHSVCKHKHTALYWASQGGYYSIAKLLVQHRADLNHQNNDGNSPLYSASKRGYLNIVKLLVEHEVDVNARNIKHQTALFCACKRNRIQIARYLIEQEADVNFTNDMGETPLLTAAENGHIDIVKLLCDKGCNINDYNNEQKTPLYFAAKNGYTEIVNYLLKVGAKSRIADKYGKSPRTMAERMGHLDIANILQQPLDT